MKEFLKPTKVTWIIFFILFFINVILGVLGILFVNWQIFIVPLFQIIWLYLFVPILIGIDVRRRVGFIPTPNFLGWALIITGTLITLFIHYFFASLISKLHYRKKNNRPTAQ